MKSNLRTVVFALVMGVVCALALTAVAEFVKPKRQANEDAERYRNVLAIFNIPVGADAGNKDIIDSFVQNVQVVGDPEKPDYYQYTVTTGGIEKTFVALPAKGPGLWGPIEGLIGLSPDGTTITAVSFYKQEETPGLGGEIASREFTDRFAGKKLFNKEGHPALRLVRPGNAEGVYKVDAISGATVTSEKVQSIITAAAEKFKELPAKE